MKWPRWRRRKWMDTSEFKYLAKVRGHVYTEVVLHRKQEEFFTGKTRWKKATWDATLYPLYYLIRYVPNEQIVDGAWDRME